ncbi:hypothetical protein QTQ03_25395 [Micromonospora sp. WMMA1363]|uniref:hypothetical protein n=1 Tax=Micromonospora sp. WMMA1363 TaxID=3053985 RepID=UPI00259D2ED9|nr:hypothetical protein [Micromonospora sp. WMMA1363]MDM4721143.1 hypothetical protein [Micromonospora sp. WMMA1363]MDM4722771.1 hypothetical protein [Micromonospora sp. WMMA1363]
MIRSPARCPTCRAVLPASGICTGTTPLLALDSRRYGIATQIAHNLGDNGDVTEDMVINWRRFDGLPRYRIGRSVYHALDEARTIERDKRLGSKGRPRRLDHDTPVAA